MSASQRPGGSGRPAAPQRAPGDDQAPRAGTPLRFDAPTLAQAFGIPLPPRAADIPPHLARLLPLLAQGLNCPQIAALLGLSPEGVHSRLRRLYPLLGAHNRVEAVRVGLRIGLVTERDLR